MGIAPQNEILARDKLSFPIPSKPEQGVARLELSEEQRTTIAANREKALERRRLKQACSVSAVVVNVAELDMKPSEEQRASIAANHEKASDGRRLSQASSPPAAVVNSAESKASSGSRSRTPPRRQRILEVKLTAPPLPAPRRSANTM